MAVGSGTPYNQHTGNGVTTVFAFEFTVLDAADFVATIDGVETSDYTLTGVGNVLGGYATFGTAPASGASVLLRRIVPLSRMTDYQANGDLQADTLNDDFDHQWMAIQQVSSKAGGALRAPYPEQFDELPEPADRADRILAFDASGNPVMLAGVAAGSAAALQLDLVNAASAVKGGTMVGFAPTLNYVGQTLAAASVDGEIHAIWFVTSAADRAAIKAGTSSVDHASLLQSVIDLFPGRRINFGGRGWRWNLSSTLTGQSGSTYCGKAKLRAINSAAYSIMLLCDGDTRVTVEDLEFDGNKANNGADYGVKFINGSKNLGLNLYVHDTAQCGGYIDGESDSFFRGGWFIDCGQNLSVSGGVATDNHGIMIIAAGLRTMSACGVQGVRVAGAYRKGVTAYVEIGATVEHIVIDGAVVSGCGLGGIYIAKQPGGTDMGTATLTGCHAWDNYVNFEIANVTNVAGAGNVSGASTAQGVVVTGVNDGAMPGFDISDSGAHGLSLVDTNNTAFGVINIRRANRGNTANQAGLAVHDSSYNVFSGGLIYDETPYQRYAILEDGTSDYNDFDGLSCVGAVTSLYFASGANSRWRTRSGANTALGAIVPRNTLDIDGGITTNEQALALGTTAGANNDVALAAKSSIVVVNNLTGAASITGIAGGHAGRRLTLVNYNGFTLTLKHADAGSTAANRFLLKSSADLVIAAQGSVELLYSSTIGGRWTVVG